MRLALGLVALSASAVLFYMGESMFDEATAAPEAFRPGNVFLTTSGPVESVDLALWLDIESFERDGATVANLTATLHVSSGDEVTFWLWLGDSAAQDVAAGHHGPTGPESLVPQGGELTTSGSWSLQDRGESRLTVLTSTVRDKDLDGQVSVWFRFMPEEELVQSSSSGLVLRLPLVGRPTGAFGEEVNIPLDYLQKLDGIDSLPDGYTRGYSGQPPSVMRVSVKVDGIDLDDVLQTNPPPDFWEGTAAIWGPTTDNRLLGVLGTVNDAANMAAGQSRQFRAGIAVGLAGGLLVLAVEQGVEAYGAWADHRTQKRQCKEDRKAQALALDRANRMKMADLRYRRIRGRR